MLSDLSTGMTASWPGLPKPPTPGYFPQSIFTSDLLYYSPLDIFKWWLFSVPLRKVAIA
jgi:hypothetical protein